jgi:hypothetical protein
MRWIVARRNLAVAVGSGLLAAGCGITGTEESRMTMSLSTTLAAIGQGSNSTVVVTFTRSNFDKPITLVAEGTLPSGVTATFSANPVAGAHTSTLLTIAAAGSAHPGTALLTVRATGDGVAEQSATVTVTVGVAGTFTLGLLTPTSTIAAGGGGKATVLVTRASNAASVTLAVSGLPSGVTASFDQSPTSQSATSLSFSATGAATPGTYPLTITASSPGYTPDQQTTLSLTVIAPPATASVTVPFCTTGIPAWFAYQNEGFAWQRVTASGSSFTFSASQKVTVAYAFVTGSQSQVNVLYVTRSDIAAFSDRDCRGPKTLSGSVAAVNAGQIATVVMGVGEGTVANGPGSFTLTDVATRPLDLLATRGAVSGGYFTPDRMVVRRALDLPTGSVIPAIDFDAAESFAPVAHTLTINGVPTGDFVDFENVLFSATSSFGTVHSARPVGAAATLYSVPAAQLAAGDMHELTILALQSSTVGRVHVSYFGAPGDRTELVGPNLSAPTLTSITSTPYVRPRLQLASQPEYATAADVFLQQATAGSFRALLVLATAGHLGATPGTWDLVVPDFTGTDGFNASWMLSAGPSTSYFAEAYSLRSEILFGGLPVAGDVLRVAFRELATAFPALRAQPRRARPSLTRPQYLRR